jgi:hypothetical protein
MSAVYVPHFSVIDDEPRIRLREAVDDLVERHEGHRPEPWTDGPLNSRWAA